MSSRSVLTNVESSNRTLGAFVESGGKPRTDRFEDRLGINSWAIVPNGFLPGCLQVLNIRLFALTAPILKRVNDYFVCREVFAGSERLSHLSSRFSRERNFDGFRLSQSSPRMFHFRINDQFCSLRDAMLKAKENRMFVALLVVQIIAVALLLLLFLRGGKQTAVAPDARFEALLSADVPAQILRADARAEALDQHLRGALSEIRRDQATEGVHSREASANAAASLRTEIVGNIDTLGRTLRDGLGGFRTDNSQAAEALRSAVEAQLATLGQRFVAFSSDANRHASDHRDALHLRLNELGKSQAEQQENLRAVVEGRLDKLNENNAAKLEEMRQTVDEKLHATLQSRLTESFGQVTDQLTKVHAGLGEMTKLSAGVDDLSRIFTNVKSRGGFAEVQLGMLLSQMLAPNQFQQNVRVKPNTLEVVEYAVRFPTPQGDTLLPIDAKFPREAWERLESAYAKGSSMEIASAGKAFETAIRTEGKRICEKYIAPPTTTTFRRYVPTY